MTDVKMCWCQVLALDTRSLDLTFVRTQWIDHCSQHICMGKHEACLRQENMKPMTGKTWNLFVTGKHETPTLHKTAYKHCLLVSGYTWTCFMRNTWNLSCLYHNHFRFDADCPLMMFCFTDSVMRVWWLWNWENMKPSLKGKHETQPWPFDHMSYLLFTGFLSHVMRGSEIFYGMVITKWSWKIGMVMNVASMTASRASYWRWPSSWCWAETHSCMGKHETCLRQENMKPMAGKTWNLL